MNKLEYRVAKRAENRDSRKIAHILNRQHKSQYQKRTAKFNRQVQNMTLEEIESEMKIESVDKKKEGQDTLDLKSKTTMR